ncbi:hypothetical protein ACFV9D_08170 [Streptomyces sp. NPDC059875]|uniref:hypothetical protein n=1 Tax=unclassified Streptomyces TaxID=2593676 RepID=UPI003659E500
MSPTRAPEDRPSLFQYIGDPDSWDLYKLTRDLGAAGRSSVAQTLDRTHEPRQYPRAARRSEAQCSPSRMCARSASRASAEPAGAGNSSVRQARSPWSSSPAGRAIAGSNANPSSWISRAR